MRANKISNVILNRLRYMLHSASMRIQEAHTELAKYGEITHLSDEDTLAYQNMVAKLEQTAKEAASFSNVMYRKYKKVGEPE